jgi:hypothetical protein
MAERLDIFVGTDRSQLLAVSVLEHSIRRRTDSEVRVSPLIDLDLPEPKDIRQGSRTGFSFARFAIPELTGYRGKALYLDADMLVFADIAELWRIPFDGAKIIIQGDLKADVVSPDKYGAPRQRVRQCAVMMIDCARTDWRVQDIVAGLDGKYTYDELMHHMCILSEDEVAYRLPFEWNSLEYWDADTKLLHYTDMKTQPWVSPRNRLGHFWIDELRTMLDSGAIAWSTVEAEVGLGYFRPSLLDELRSGPTAWDETRAMDFVAADGKAGFVIHAEVFRRKRAREEAVKAYLQSIEAAPATAQRT